MTHFAVLLTRRGAEWDSAELSLDECESLADVAELAGDYPADVRLVFVEQDDEYAAIVRADDDAEPRAFLTDGHAADSYPIAAVIAENLTEIGGEGLEDADVPPLHDSAPFGDAEIVDDLGTSATELLALCAHAGTLPMDVLSAVADNAGCGEILEDVRV